MVGVAKFGRFGSGWANVGLPAAIGVALRPKTIHQVRQTSAQYTAHHMLQETQFQNPPTIDPIAAARWDGWPHNQSPWLNEEIGRRMQERLAWIRLQPQAWLDWQPLSGGLMAHQLVRQRYAKAVAHVFESTAQRQSLAKKALASSFWHRLTRFSSESFGLPQEAAVDMIWANMALHVSAQPQKLLQIWHKYLAADGFLMFSCLGPDTLRELAEVYADAGWPAPHHAFTDMHDWGDMLVQAGFAEPVMDMERITLTYDSREALVTELRQLGRNLNINRFAGLRSRNWYEQFKNHLQKLSSEQGRNPLKITVEVIYGHAIKPKPRAKVAPESTVSLQDMRGMLRQPRG
jgi:malonyl-CoA O-methyltransferase